MSKLSLLSTILVSLSLAACNLQDSEKAGFSSKIHSELSIEPSSKSSSELSDIEVDTPPNCGPKQIPVYITDYKIQEGLGSKAVKWDELTIALSPKDLQHLARKSFKIRFSLFPQAYACPPSWFVTEQTITGFSIVSDAFFSDDLAPGSELKHLFIDQNKALDLTTYPSEESNSAPTNLYLGLLQEPTEKRHNFTITIEFSDGNISEVQTGEVNFGQE